MKLHANAQRSADLCQRIRTGETQSQRILIELRAGVATSPPRVLSGWSKNRLWNNGRQLLNYYTNDCAYIKFIKFTH